MKNFAPYVSVRKEERKYSAEKSNKIDIFAGRILACSNGVKRADSLPFDRWCYCSFTTRCLFAVGATVEKYSHCWCALLAFPLTFFMFLLPFSLYFFCSVLDFSNFKIVLPPATNFFCFCFGFDFFVFIFRVVMIFNC